MAKAINAKLLEGLIFRTTVEKKVTGKDKKEKKIRQAVERPLTPDDVLEWKDKGDEVVIVTKDGQKYTVSKKSEKPA